MATDVTMPRLSDTMEEGKILKWLKNVGDRVAPGDVLAEVETDKANMELEAFDDGTLSEIRVGEGESAPVGAVIAVLDGETAGTGAPAPKKKAEAARPVPAPEKRAPPVERAPAAEEAPAPEEAEEPAEPAEPEVHEEPAATKPAEPSAKPAPAAPRRAEPAPKPAQPAEKQGAKAAPPAAAEPGDRVRISPRARRIASERGIDLGSVRGTGPGGRILELDLEAKRERLRPVGQRVELSKIRRTTATRMAAAKRDIPHFYASTEIDAGALVRLKDELRGRGGAWKAVTITHLLLKGVGLALRQVPEMNSSWNDGAILVHPEVNVGVAVAIDDGLVVPVIRRCDSERLEMIVAKAAELVARARAGRFAGDDLVGATFTISNLGMFPVVRFAAVVNPPHAGILAVGATRPVPVVRDGAVVPGQLMDLTLSCDHRVVDGVIAGRFLREVKTRLEDPGVLAG